MKKKKKRLILISSIIVFLLTTVIMIWQFAYISYEGANEIEKFKNKIEINYQTAKARKEAIEEAARNGNAVAQYYLGLRHTQGGMGISKDYKETIKWWKKSAANGYAYAGQKLSDCYLRGSYGVSKDKKEAVKWYKKAEESYKKAADAGDDKAQYQLGLIYTRGRTGIPINNKEAFKYFKESAESGNADSQFRMGLCYDLGMLKTKKSSYEAQKWYKKAAAQGNNRAQLSLGSVHAKSGDYENAVKEWKKAEDKKSLWAQFCMMRCYELGLGVPKNPEKEKEYFKKITSRLGRRYAGFLGYAYYYGSYGLPKDKEKGLKYLELAVKSGNKRAARTLKRIKKRNYR